MGTDRLGSVSPSIIRRRTVRAQRTPCRDEGASRSAPAVRRGLRLGARALAALAAMFMMSAVMGSATAFADENQCPASGTGNPQVDELVGASYTVAGNTATYKFDSLANESPEEGVP